MASVSAADDAASVETFDPGVSPREWKFIVLHHTATTGGSVESIDRNHRQRTDRAGNPWLGIGYHFLIGNGDGMPDGQVEPTFRWRGQLAGAHSGSTEHNAAGIGICLVGNFEDAAPSERQLAAARSLVQALARRYGVPAERILPHSAVVATKCPGKLFPLEELRAALAAADAGAQEQSLIPAGPTHGGSG